MISGGPRELPQSGKPQRTLGPGRGEAPPGEGAHEGHARVRGVVRVLAARVHPVLEVRQPANTFRKSWFRLLWARFRFDCHAEPFLILDAAPTANMAWKLG